MTENKSKLESKLEEKKEIVGVPGTPMTPAEAQENERQLEREDKEREDKQIGERNMPPDAAVNQPTQPSHPETIRSARATEKESGEHKGQRVDEVEEHGGVDRTGEKAPQGWGKKPTVYVMTNVDGEKLSVTVKQWAKYGQKLRAKGWLTPAFADGDQGGNEDIPQDIDWGKDAPGDPPAST